MGLREVWNSTGEGTSLSFEKEYFVQSERSNYRDYRKRKFSELAADLIKIVPILKNMRVLDFGCATGALLIEFKKRGIKNVVGTDISDWAVDYAHRVYGLIEEVHYHNKDLLRRNFDVVLFLDVLEHIPRKEEIIRFIYLVPNTAKIVVRVPVAAKEGENYVLEVSRNDTTHVQCHTKEWWLQVFGSAGVSKWSFLTGYTIYNSEGVLAVRLEK